MESPIGWMVKDGKDLWSAIMDLLVTLEELQCTLKVTHVPNAHQGHLAQMEHYVPKDIEIGNK